ncbi:hypothetical protein HWV62_43770 [Athelia sp. TMB]|nr:hypothetical protein HWV62_43770 [Athelia sp. TMB]
MTTPQEGIPLGAGPPSAEELRDQRVLQRAPPIDLHLHIESDLGLLKRSKALQVRYDKWIVGVKEQYGSSVPSEIEHTLIWTRLPIIDFHKVPAQISDRLRQDGLWGFTGCDLPPPSPSTLPECLPALAEWGVTMGSLISSPRATPEEELMIKAAGREVDNFVKRRWIGQEWETAWFVNPPVSRFW